MTKYKDDGYVDLDHEVVRRKDGSRLTEKDAAEWGEQIAKRAGRGRPSLSGEPKRSPQIAVRVPGDVRDRLAARAKREGKTLSQLAREALESFA